MDNHKLSKIDLEKMRHSTAHVLAMAVSELYPNVRLGIGPATDNGFYYDFDMPAALNKDELEDIENKMYEIKSRDLSFVQQVLPRQEAINLLNSRGQLYKTELIADLEDDEMSIYETGDEFLDLCRGPHVSHTGEIGFFKLSEISGAYWKGDPSRPQMQRITGFAFESKEQLDEYIDEVEKSKNIDHRNLGRELNLYITDHDYGKGVNFWLGKGNFVKNRVIKYLMKQLEKASYQNVSTPVLSYPVFEDEAYFSGSLGRLDLEEQYYLRKDMNIDHSVVFSRMPRIAAQLPLRYCEVGTVFSDEKSGEIAGLYKSREYLLPQATTFCVKEDFIKEFDSNVDLIRRIFSNYKIDEFYIRINTKGKKGVYNKSKEWKYFEEKMKSYFDDQKIKFLEVETMRNYAGPRVDFIVRDMKGRDITLSSISIDLVVGDRMELMCIDESEKTKEVYCLVTNIVESVDRFVGFLTEKQLGAFNYELSPIQVVVIPIAERFNYFANQALSFLIGNKVRAVFDDRNEKMQSKIRDAQLERTPFMIIIGQKEVDNDSLSIRDRAGKDLGMMKKEEVLKVLK